MRRYLYLLSPLLILLSVSYAVAQTLTTDEPAPQKLWEIVLKLGFPVVLAFVGPYVTSFISSMPPTAKVALSSLVSMVLGGLAGTIPDFPMGPESAATIGLTLGGSSQVAFNMMPPKPTAGS